MEKSSWGLLVKQRPHMKCRSSLNFASTCVCLHLLEPEVNTHLVCVLTHRHSVFTPATVQILERQAGSSERKFSNVESEIVLERNIVYIPENMRQICMSENTMGLVIKITSDQLNGSHKQ